MNEIPASLLVDSRSLLGEGAHWNAASGALSWVDIERGSLHTYSSELGSFESIKVGRYLTAVASIDDRLRLIALDTGLATIDIETRQLAHFPAPPIVPPNSRMNDGKCDSAGRFWVGTMTFDHSPTGFLWSYEASGVWKLRLTGIACSNGIAWAANDQTMYYIDTYTRRIDSYCYDPGSGDLGKPREVFRIPEKLGYPDGMAIDSQDNLWIAIWGAGQVIQLDPVRGKVLSVVKVPASQVTSCTFGGPDLAQLFITTARVGLTPDHLSREPHAGGVFVATPGVSGAPIHKFRL